LSVSSPSEVLVQPGSLGKPGKPSPSASIGVVARRELAGLGAGGAAARVADGHSSTPAATSGSLQAAPIARSPRTFSVYAPLPVPQPSTETM
jgi:hypothetical protein